MESARELNFKEALMLYEIIAPHVPEGEPESALDYFSDIVGKLYRSGQENYVKTIKILANREKYRDKVIDDTDALEILLDGFKINKIVRLIQFVRLIRGISSG